MSTFGIPMMILFTAMLEIVTLKYNVKFALKSLNKYFIILTKISVWNMLIKFEISFYNLIAL